MFGWKWICGELNALCIAAASQCQIFAFSLIFFLDLCCLLASKSHGKVMWLKINGCGSCYGYLVATDRLITAGNGLHTQTWLRWHIRQTLAFSSSALVVIDGVHSVNTAERVWKATAVIAHTLQKSIQPSVNINHTQCQDGKHWHLTLSKKMWCRYTPTWWANQLPEFLPATNSVNKTTGWLCFHSNTCFMASPDNFHCFLIEQIKCQLL